MKKLFEIGDVQEQQQDDWLLLECGVDFCCTAQYNHVTKQINHLAYQQWDMMEEPDAISDWLQQFHEHTYDKVIAGISLPSALLMPLSYAHHAKEAVRQIYDEADHTCRLDRIGEWQVVNAWSLPLAWEQQVLKLHGDAEVYHAYTPDLKVYNGFSVEDQVAIHFAPHHFRVMVKKGGELQLAQLYAYTTPLDVVYYLLKIVSSFDFNQSQVYVILSGLIDERSALFKELQSYFIQLHFSRPQQLTLPENELPEHYFTSIYKLVACAS